MFKNLSSNEIIKHYRTPIVGYIFVIPSLFFIVVFLIYPLISAFIVSFHRWDGVGTPTFIGLKNYINLLIKDDIFFLAIKNTLIYSLISTIGITIIGFLLALTIDRRVAGWKIYKVLWFLPVVMSRTVVSVLWSKLYDPKQGLINKILDILHLDFLKNDWLGNPDIAIISAGIVDVWQYTGLGMIILLVAMEAIPIEIHEAATLDGVNPLRRATHIVFPLIKDVLVTLILFLFISAAKTFDTIYVLTKGGPGNSTTVLPLHLYNNAFRYFKFGYASSIAVFMLILLITLSLLYQKASKTGKGSEE